MITLLQRVSASRVEIDAEVVGQIDRGVLLLVGVQAEDDAGVADKFVERVLNYRVFSDADGKMNLSLRDIDGGLLLVPQFTLAADTRKGRRPSFTSAAPPQHGQQIFEALVDIALCHFPDGDRDRVSAITDVLLAFRAQADRQRVRPPGTAELLDAVRACEELDIPVARGPESLWSHIERAVLAKDRALWPQGQ